MAADLKIIVTAQDQASSVLNGVKGELSGIDDQAKKAGGGLGALGGVLKGGLAVGAGIAAAGIAGLGAVIGSSIGEAMAAQEVQAQLDAVLKSTGGAAGVTADEIGKMADSLSKVTRFEDDAIVSADALLLTFTNIGKDVFPEVNQAMVDMSQAMGQDLRTSALQLGKALNNPAEGMAALRRVGVQFTDAQEQAIKAMVEAGDVAGAQRLILAELKREFGGSAEAAGKTLPGQLEILKNQLGNVKEEIGGAFIPILTDLATQLGPVLISAAQGLADFIVNQLVPAIQDAAQWFQANMLPAIQAVGGWIQANLVPILQVVWTWLATNIPPAIEALAKFWKDVLQPALQVVWQFIQDKILPILKVLIETYFKAWKLELQALKVLWENVLLPALKAVWEFLSTYVIPIIIDLVEIAFASLKAAVEFAADLWNNLLKPALMGVWAFIQDNILPIFVALVDALNGPVTEAMNAIGGVIDGVIGWFQRLFDKIHEVIEAFKEFLGISDGGGVPSVPNSGRAPTGRMAGAGRGPMIVVTVSGNTFGQRSDVDYLLKQLDRRLRLEGGILPS